MAERRPPAFADQRLPSPETRPPHEAATPRMQLDLNQREAKTRGNSDRPPPPKAWTESQSPTEQGRLFTSETTSPSPTSFDCTLL